MKPMLFVTGHAPFDRVGAFALLHEREDVEFALFGGPSQHGGVGVTEDFPFPHRHIRQRDVAALAASGRHRAVVVSAGGRLALPGAWAGARRARIPVILWSALWAHPRTAAHSLSYLALLRLYRSADAVVTYGPHVSAYVRAHGARNVHVAPQSVDNAFWSHPLTAPDIGPPADPPWPEGAAVKFLFAGRPVREKGFGVLREAWLESGLRVPSAALVLVGVGSDPPWVSAGGAAWRGTSLARRLPPSMQGSSNPSPRSSPAGRPRASPQVEVPRPNPQTKAPRPNPQTKAPRPNPQTKAPRPNP